MPTEVEISRQVMRQLQNLQVLGKPGNVIYTDNRGARIGYRIVCFATATIDTGEGLVGYLVGLDEYGDPHGKWCVGFSSFALPGFGLIYGDAPPPTRRVVPE